MPFDLIVSQATLNENVQWYSALTCFFISALFPLPQNGKFVPEKSNIWRDCVDGYYDWVKEHIEEVS